MFTGIIRHVGKVTNVRPSAGGARLAIDLGPLAAGLGLGDSMAVRGVCLTAAALDGRIASFDVIAETLKRTMVGELKVGDRVNLEPSLRVGQGLDGHIVQGHVDGLATLRTIVRGGQYVLEFSATTELTGQMVAKGSVAIDGVSLTLVEVSADRFSVALIPTTLGETTLGDLRPGDKVHIETDVIGRYVLKYLAQMGLQSPAAGGLTMEKLKDAGFL